MRIRKRDWLAVAVAALASASLQAGDQPQLGSAWNRNHASPEIGLPDSFDPATGSNIVWSVDLGTESHATPVVAKGKVYIGTNNGRPRDARRQGDRGVLMCLDERDGRLLWQLVIPKRPNDIYLDWPRSGICSSPTIEGDRVYIVSNRGEVLCLDAEGMANGNDGPFKDEAALYTPEDATEPGPPVGPLDADVIWRFDMVTGAGIWTHDGAHSSILIRGDHLYLNTGTGVDNTHKVIRTPDAPSLIVLDKKTGRLLARERESIAPDIFHATWSCPALGSVKGRETIVFAAGNAVIYGFAPIVAQNPANRLQKLWQVDFDPAAPKQNIHEYLSNRKESPSTIHGRPVLEKDRLYVAGGGDIWWGKTEAWVRCYDTAGRSGSPELLWSYPLSKHVLATPCVADNMVFVGDSTGKFHCIDAATGKEIWTQALKGQVWGSALAADGKIFIGTRSGAFYVFAQNREKRLIGSIDLGAPTSATPIAANGRLYVATVRRLIVAQKAAVFCE